MCVFKDMVINTSKNRVFVTSMSEDNQATIEVADTQCEQDIDALCATESSIFAGSACNQLVRIAPAGSQFEVAAKVKLPGHAYSLSGDDEKMFALCHTG